MNLRCLECDTGAQTSVGGKWVDVSERGREEGHTPAQTSGIECGDRDRRRWTHAGKLVCLYLLMSWFFCLWPLRSLKYKTDESQGVSGLFEGVCGARTVMPGTQQVLSTVGWMSE